MVYDICHLAGLFSYLVNYAKNINEQSGLLTGGEEKSRRVSPLDTHFVQAVHIKESYKVRIVWTR